VRPYRLVAARLELAVCLCIPAFLAQTRVLAVVRPSASPTPTEAPPGCCDLSTAPASGGCFSISESSDVGACASLHGVVRARFACDLVTGVCGRSPDATATPSPIVGCSDVCDGRLCRLPDNRGGNCLVALGGGCECAPEVTPVSPTPRHACIGDCNSDGAVGVDELIAMVNIALGDQDLSGCLQGVPNSSTVDVALIIAGVNNALGGCSSS